MKQKRSLSTTLGTAEKSINDEQQKILDDFRQAWHEAMTGATIPIDQLWDDIDCIEETTNSNLLSS